MEKQRCESDFLRHFDVFLAMGHTKKRNFFFLELYTICFFLLSVTKFEQMHKGRRNQALSAKLLLMDFFWIYNTFFFFCFLITKFEYKLRKADDGWTLFLELYRILLFYFFNY